MYTDIATPVPQCLRRAIVDYAFVRGDDLRPKIIRPRTAAVLTIRLSGSVSVNGCVVPLATVGGVHENPFTLVPSSSLVDFVRVQFTSGGLRYFSRVAASTLRRRSVSADSIFPREMVFGLVKELRATCDVDMRIDALDRFFTSLYSPLGPRNVMVLDLAERLAHDPETDVSGIMKSAPVGVRQIERLFASLIGFSPRTFARVSRFERVEQEVLSNVSSSFTELALRGGYFDQAHFNRDFKQFTSMPPKAYSFCVSPGVVTEG